MKLTQQHIDDLTDMAMLDIRRSVERYEAELLQETWEAIRHHINVLGRAYRTLSSVPDDVTGVRVNTLAKPIKCTPIKS